ncbi:MAG: protein-export chaperone SecB [Tissierellaceae bacterium]
MDTKKSALRFIDYYVNEIEFYNNESFEERTVKIDFSISHEIEYSGNGDNTFYVTLTTVIFKDAVSNNYPFSMKVSLTGIFEIDEDNIKNIERYAKINSIAILFPYVRSLISTYTANANVQPLILPPINVVNMLKAENES